MGRSGWRSGHAYRSVAGHLSISGGNNPVDTHRRIVDILLVVAQAAAGRAERAGGLTLGTRRRRRDSVERLVCRLPVRLDSTTVDPYPATCVTGIHVLECRMLRGTLFHGTRR